MPPGPPTSRASHLGLQDAVPGRAPGPPVKPVRSLRRRPLRAAVASLVVAVFSLLGALLYASAGHKVAVLAVRREVRRGQVIRAGDLVATHISPSNALRPVAAADEATVVGRRSALRLVPGELLTTGVVATGPALPAGTAEVGVSLRPGELPENALSAGDPVEVVRTMGRGTAAGSAVPPGGTALGTGTVAAPPVHSRSSGDTELRLIVPKAMAPAVATESAAGRVAVVALPRHGSGQP